MDVSVTIDADGAVTVVVSDEAGYSPDIVDDLARRARENAVAVHQQLHPAKAKPASRA